MHADMINYATSPLAALAATPPGGGTPPTPGFIPPETILKTRESLTGLVGNGFTDLSNPTAQGAYARMVALHGPQVARKLLFQVMQFNQRPDMVAKTPEQRVQSFYEMGSQDPETQNILHRSAMLGAGPVADSRNSWDSLNQDMTGRGMTARDKRNSGTPDELKKAAAALK